MVDAPVTDSHARRWSGALERTVAQLPRRVYRIKGFVHSATDPDHRQLLQAVGMRCDVQPFDRWEGRVATTELVIIADAGHADPDQVNTMLDACQVTV